MASLIETIEEGKQKRTKQKNDALPVRSAAIKQKKNTHPSSSHTLANIVLEINRVSNDFYWVFTEFYCGLLSFHGYHPVLRGYLVLLGFT